MYSLSIFLSVVIPVYKRSDDIFDLLKSLKMQTLKAFEVIVVDDGSPEPLKSMVSEFDRDLSLRYFYISNVGAGRSRNYASDRCRGNYLVFLDSDTVVPEDYISEIYRELHKVYVDFWGGSDTSKESFSILQKAINFSMTSHLTTGGIRGGNRRLAKFQPRSFNMGVSLDAFKKVGGFGEMSVGEDIELTLKLWEDGFTSRFFPTIQVYHKRRSSLSDFFYQIYSFGKSRALLNEKYSFRKKIIFWLPSFFIVGFVVMSIDWSLCFYSFLIFYVSYFFLVFLLSTMESRSLRVGFLAIITTFLQFFAYAVGFFLSQIRIHVFKNR